MSGNSKFLNLLIITGVKIPISNTILLFNILYNSFLLFSQARKLWEVIVRKYSFSETCLSTYIHKNAMVYEKGKPSQFVSGGSQQNTFFPSMHRHRVSFKMYLNVLLLQLTERAKFKPYVNEWE